MKDNASGGVTFGYNDVSATLKHLSVPQSYNIIIYSILQFDMFHVIMYNIPYFFSLSSIDLECFFKKEKKICKKN